MNLIHKVKPGYRKRVTQLRLKITLFTVLSTYTENDFQKSEKKKALLYVRPLIINVLYNIEITPV
jgi:hypothetical protein